MDVAEFLNRLWFLPPLIWATCGLLWLIRGRKSLGSILGGVGFLLLFLSGALLGILRGVDQFGDLEVPELYELAIDLYPYTSIIFLIGQILIIVGFATAKFGPARSESTTYAPPEPRYADPDPESEDRPGVPVDDEPRPSAAPAPPPPRGYGPPGYGPPPYPPRPYMPDPMGPPAPLHRPGWALAGSWIALSILAFIFLITAVALLIDSGRRTSDDELAGILIAYFMSILFSIPGVIIYFVWLYRSWSAVPPEYRSTSPGKAVGFLFIPFFNLYWIFRAIPGLSASTKRAQLALDPSRAGGASFGIAVTACVIGLIPYIGILSWFVFLIWIILQNGDTNRLLVTRMEREA